MRQRVHAVGVYAVTDQEHRRRGKKHKESDRGQKERNKHASLRRKQRKAIANFGRDGFFLTGTYEESYLPEDFAACRRDVENYKRRVIGATVKRFGVSRDKIRLMLWAVRKGEAGRLHMHAFAECVGDGSCRPAGNGAKCWKICGGGACREQASTSLWAPYPPTAWT